MICLLLLILFIGIIWLDKNKIIDLSEKYIGYTLFSLPIIWNYCIPFIIYKISFYKTNIIQFIITIGLYAALIIYILLCAIFNLSKNKKQNDYKIGILREYLIMLLFVLYVPLIILMNVCRRYFNSSNNFFVAFFILSNLEVFIISWKIFVDQKKTYRL